MPAKPAPMKGSVRIGSFAGIGVFIHWTFFLLPAVLAGTELMAAGPVQDRVAAAIENVVLVLATFACVVLHEFGHALTAKRFGVRTRDIVLLPIGGVARLERIPRDPVQELWIALAGPAVNVAIVTAIGLVLVAVGTLRGDLLSVVSSSGPFGWLITLASINVALVVFNMIPAFPMDGGRVLRALLALWLPYARATAIAARVGQVIAIAFFAAGLYFGHVVLLLVAGMVFLGAAAEGRQAQIVEKLEGLKVRDAMMSDFDMVPAQMPLARCAELLIVGAQQNFPVVTADSGARSARYIGMLQRGPLLEAISAGSGDRPAESIASTDPPRLHPDEPAVSGFERMQAAGVSCAPVLVDGAPVGLVTMENIAELLELRSAVQAGHRPHGFRTTA